jgi:hypothetical protein
VEKGFRGEGGGLGKGDSGARGGGWLSLGGLFRAPLVRRFGRGSGWNDGFGVKDGPGEECCHRNG